MSGNFMFIVCEPCSKANEPDFGFKFAERGVIGCYEPFGPAKQTAQFATWLKKHQKCGGKGKPDHFLLAHAGERNWDQPSPAVIDRALKVVN